MPLAITLMAKLGWVDAPFLKRYRKWAFLGSFLFAALLTPTPDPFNQCLMALPMYFFYEIGIISAGFFQEETGGNRRRRDACRRSRVKGLRRAATSNGREWSR